MFSHRECTWQHSLAEQLSKRSSSTLPSETSPVCELPGVSFILVSTTGHIGGLLWRRSRAGRLLSENATGYFWESATAYTREASLTAAAGLLAPGDRADNSLYERLSRARALPLSCLFLFLCLGAPFVETQPVTAS